MTTSSTQWTREWSVDGAIEFRLGRDPGRDEMIAEWVGVGVLRASRRGDWGTFHPAEGVDAERIQKFYDGPVRAFLRHLRGGMTLHASGAGHRGSVLACLGASGAGKSTAIAELCRREGIELVSDDTLAIEFDADGVRVIPTQRVHWLLPDAASALGVPFDDARKQPHSPARTANGEGKLAALVHLVFDDAADAPVLSRVKGGEAFEILTRSMFRFVLDEREVQARDFAQLARLHAEVPLYELRRPRRLDQLAAAGAILGSLLEGGGAR